MEPVALSLTDLLHPDLGNWSDHSEEDKMEEADELLLLASQQYESALPTPATASSSAAPAPNDLNQIFLAALQQFEQAESENATPRSKEGWFSDPVTSLCVEQSRKSGIPPKTCQQTLWALRVWGEWAKQRNELPRVETSEACYELTEDFVKMPVSSLQLWLPKFV